MDPKDAMSNHERWAHFRLSVIGHLLASPPQRGELQGEIEQLEEKKSWKHPITKEPLELTFPTIERWYYMARIAANPVDRLCRKLRSDAGSFRSVSEQLAEAIRSQYETYKSWSYRLHYDNLKALAREDKGEDTSTKQRRKGLLPSYTTLVRYMRANGLRKRRRQTRRQTAGAELAARRFDKREVRSFEKDHVNALWHLDFHVSSLRVLTREGEWVWPVLCCILDDRSRLTCHAQWYFSESAQNVAHTIVQALLKRGLPRGLMTDRGPAMMAEEITGGLSALSIDHDPTLPYSPYQNGKLESFWGQVEGRVLAMLEKVKDLTLYELQRATQAWLELDYNREVHTETKQSPIERFVAGPDVGRPSLDLETLRRSFRVRRGRRQRLSDGTITLEGKRFEIPSRYERLDRVKVSYARWDLSQVDMLDERSNKPVCRLYPQDKSANANAQRRTRSSASPAPAESASTEPKDRFPPLMRELLRKYAETGLPPTVIPNNETVRLKTKGEQG